ncbi:MAG: sigma-70 family RNA polymerase sigma factor [Terriglobales bacterium]
MATCVISATAPKVVPVEKPNWDHSHRPSLVQRAHEGDEQAFAALFQTHKKRVYSMCLFMTKDVAEVEDLTQEAFLRVFRKIDSLRGDAAFPISLYHVAVNTMLMKRRRRKSPPAASLDQPLSPESSRGYQHHE